MSRIRRDTAVEMDAVSLKNLLKRNNHNPSMLSTSAAAGCQQASGIGGLLFLSLCELSLLCECLG